MDLTASATLWPRDVVTSTCRSLATISAFVSPRTAESLRHLSTGVPKQDCEDILALFAREAGAGRDRIILLVLDNAARHRPPEPAVPEGIRLVHLPPCTPELQPAETPWAHRDQPIVNRHFDSLDELDPLAASQCVRLTADRDRVRDQAGFPRWPDRVVPI